jgi:voltage-gated sodium channel
VAFKERTVLAVVAINALALLLDAFPAIHAGFGDLLFAIDYICIVYFLVEVSYKLWAYGGHAYFLAGWNTFDFIIVVVSLPALLVPFGIGEHMLAGVLVLRLARLFRFLRILRFIPNLERMMEGAKRALKASVGVLLVLLLWNFILGLAATYFFSGPNCTAHEHFSDPLVSMYTLFKVFTMEGWYEMPDLIAGAAPTPQAHLVRLFFIASVVFGGIIILGLLNAVFVDQMTSDLAEKTEDEVEALAGEVGMLRHELSTKLDDLAARLKQLR